MIQMGCHVCFSDIRIRTCYKQFHRYHLILVVVYCSYVTAFNLHCKHILYLSLHLKFVAIFTTDTMMCRIYSQKKLHSIIISLSK